MTTFERYDIIRKAYDFEVEAIKNCDSTRNPWFDTIMSMPNGKEIWEIVNVTLEMVYGNE